MEYLNGYPIDKGSLLLQDETCTLVADVDGEFYLAVVRQEGDADDTFADIVLSKEQARKLLNMLEEYVND